jgi:hypothetical protein
MAVEIPLFEGNLMMRVNVSDANTVRDPYFLEEWDRETNWGEPLTGIHGPDPETPRQDTHRLFWEGQVPVFVF